MSARQQTSAFWAGFTAFFGAARGLIGLSRAWPYALVPTFVFVLLEAAIVGVAWAVLKPWMNERFGGDGTWQSLGALALSWGSVLLTALMGWLVAAFLTPPLSAPALERIVAIVESELGVPERSPLGFFAEFWCGVRSLLLSSAVTVPIVLLLSLLELVLPPAAVVATPLKLTVGALGVAWGLLDYPLTLRGVGARQRLTFMKRHAGAALGFGSAFALVFWLPCCGIVMLPVGVAAATRLLWELERRDAAATSDGGRRGR